MNQYDRKVSDQYKVPQPIVYQQKQLEFPQKNSLVDHFVSGMMTYDLNDYRQYKDIQNPPPPSPPQPETVGPKLEFMDLNLGKDFVPIRSNYLDFNVNTKQLGQGLLLPMGQRINENQPVLWQRNQMNFQQPLQDFQNPEYVLNLKKHIESLGGIEDTVGNMQSSLNNFEIKHLIYKNIRNYPNPFEVQVPPPPPPNPEDELKYKPHPFIYNPAEDQERFQNQLKQASIIMQQTVASQFQQTLRQQDQFQQIQPLFVPSQPRVIEDIQQIQEQQNKFQSIQQSRNLREQKNRFLENLKK